MRLAEYLWMCGIWGVSLGVMGCPTKQVVRQLPRDAQPPAPRPAPPQARPKPGALRLVTSRRYALSGVGRFLGGGRKGRLTPVQVQPPLAAATPALKACMHAFHKRVPNASQTFSMRLWIGPEGRVWRSAFTGEIRSDTRTLRCLRGVLHRLRFPAPGGFFVWEQHWPLRPNRPQPRR